MKKDIPSQVVNPFSDAFLPEWELWKLYKEEAFDFKYKGVISEQMALKHLVELSDGDEDKAIKIIQQSCRRQWQGFFPLKETTHGTKQQSTKTTGGAKTIDLRDRVRAAAQKRYGGGEQPTSEPNSEAV